MQRVGTIDRSVIIYSGKIYAARHWGELLREIGISFAEYDFDFGCFVGCVLSADEYDKLQPYWGPIWWIFEWIGDKESRYPHLYGRKSEINN